MSNKISYIEIPILFHDNEENPVLAELGIDDGEEGDSCPMLINLNSILSINPGGRNLGGSSVNCCDGRWHSPMEYADIVSLYKNAVEEHNCSVLEG